MDASNITNRQQILVSSFVLVLLSGDGPPERALPQDNDTMELPDRFMVRGGANFIWNAETNMRLSGERGIGGIINYGDALKGEQTATVPRVDAYFRFNPKHSIGFKYYRVGKLRLDLTQNYGPTFSISRQLAGINDRSLFRRRISPLQTL